MCRRPAFFAGAVKGDFGCHTVSFILQDGLFFAHKKDFYSLILLSLSGKILNFRIEKGFCPYTLTDLLLRLYCSQSVNLLGLFTNLIKKMVLSYNTM